MNKQNHFSRRDFLKLSGLGLGSITLGNLTLGNWESQFRPAEFPDAENLARVCEQYVNVRAKPDVNSAQVGTLYEDDVVPWLREVVGGKFSNPYRANQRWVETPHGYIWSPLLQPVKNIINTPMETLYDTSMGPGMWVQVSVPWVEVQLENSAPYFPSTRWWIEQGMLPRFYYSQVFWVDAIKNEGGTVWYHLTERWKDNVAIEKFWGEAKYFRVITPEEMAPLSPEVENKRIDINIHQQTLSCFEDDREVFFARISSGKLGEDEDGRKYETPPGLFYYVWRKMMSAHMIGGTTGGGYDLHGVGFTTLFIGDGVAIHSTFWHNNYGDRTSHGCINCRPEDAQWIFRWVKPAVGYDPGDITVEGFVGSNIRVIEY